MEGASLKKSCCYTSTLTSSCGRYDIKASTPSDTHPGGKKDKVRLIFLSLLSSVSVWNLEKKLEAILITNLKRNTF